MSTLAQPVDLLDSLLGIVPGSALHDVRHARAKVVAATQSSQELFFDAQLADGLSLEERLLVAYYACLLTPQPLLAEHYLQQLQGADRQLLHALAEDNLQAIAEPRLSAILTFTATLIQAPVEGGRSALLALKAAGLNTLEIVALGQLIAYLSYQVRLTAGLKALQGTTH